MGEYGATRTQGVNIGIRGAAKANGRDTVLANASSSKAEHFLSHCIH